MTPRKKSQLKWEKIQTASLVFAPAAFRALWSVSLLFPPSVHSSFFFCLLHIVGEYDMWERCRVSPECGHCSAHHLSRLLSQPTVWGSRRSRAVQLEGRAWRGTPQNGSSGGTEEDQGTESWIWPNWEVTLRTSTPVFDHKLELLSPLL